MKTNERSALTDMCQKLDQKILQRLETAVAKSEYSQGQRLKVVTKVSERSAL